MASRRPAVRILSMPCSPNRVLSVLLILVLAVAGCGRKQGFDSSSEDAFVASCAKEAQGLDARLGLPKGVAAELISFYGVPPPELRIDRNFDPTVVIPVAGADLLGSPDTTAACRLAATAREGYGEISAEEAMNLGTSRLLSELSAEDGTLRVIRSTIVAFGENERNELTRLREAMNRNAPRGVEFRVVASGNRYVPSIVVSAVNAVGRPINAFLMTVHLVQADGTFIGTGRVRFVPPVPLGAAAQAFYTINLAGVSGLDTKAVVGYSGAVRVVAVLDDLVVEGKPMLGDPTIEPTDRARVDVIDVVRSGIARFSAFVKRIRGLQVQADG